MLSIIESGIISREVGRGAFMPVITPLPNGTFVACQNVGTGLGTEDHYIEILRSCDGGVVWHNEGGVHGVEGSPNDGWSYRGAAISVVPDGRLVMTATRFKKTGGSLFNPNTEALQQAEMLLLWSEDQGHNWSLPQVVPVELSPEKYTWNGAGTLLQLSRDRWMYPLETWKPDGYKGPPDQKAAVVFSYDQGRTWEDFTIVADDPNGNLLWWDQMCTILPDGRIYTLIWTHKYGTSEDVINHWVISEDSGKTWSEPTPTNLHGQVCAPVALPDGQVVAIYNYRHDPQGIRAALTKDLSTFDVRNEIVVFDAGFEATTGDTQNENYLAEHMLIAFGKPGGILLPNGNLMAYFWCTVQNVTHTRWVRLGIEV